MTINHFLIEHGWFEQLKEPGVIIYHCRFAIPGYDDRHYTALQVPKPDKLARAVDKRKSEFLAGRFCAAKALAEFGVERFEVVADKNRCPLWPVGIKGAITHSNSNAMVALTRNDVLGIGIDIEDVMSEETMNNVKKAIVLDDENDFLARSDIGATTAASLIFSIKESFFKAAYPSTGRYFDFDAVRVTELDLDSGRFRLTVKQDLNPRVRPGMECEGQFGFVGDQVLSLMVI